MDLYPHYLALKRHHPDTILFFRVGDFYEVFEEDARMVARELQITLTSRPMAAGIRLAMAGLPSHSLDLGLARLIARGHRVAVTEQLTETGPANVSGSEPPATDAGCLEATGDMPQQLSLPLP